MKYKYQLKNSSNVRISSAKQYAELTPTEKGLVIYFTDFSTKRDSFLQRRDLISDTTHLPKRIVYAYEWQKNPIIETKPLKKDMILLVGKLKGEIPKPIDFSNLVSFPITYDPEQATKSYTVSLSKRKLQVPTKENVIISLHWGNQLFGEIKSQKDTKYKDLTYLKQEYGENLQAYPFLDISYRISALQKAIEIPAIWLQKAKLEKESKIWIYEMENGTILFSTGKKVCDFCGKTIDPILIRPFEKPMCKNCYSIAKE